MSGDVFAMYFTKAAYDRAKLSKEEFALLKEQEDKEKKEADEKAKEASRDRPPAHRQRPKTESPIAIRLGRHDTTARCA